jgi:5'-deoxynucleotidase YfbR-like HD superfamily hydrolase
LFHNVGKLKDLKRSGWVAHSVQQPESVAGHCFRVAFIAMILGDFLGLDTSKLLKMSLLHDLGEVITGDITPSMKIEKLEKQRGERQALGRLLAGVESGQAYIDLWEEFENGTSAEANLLKNIDKLEMGLQALEYGRQLRGENLGQFVENAEGAIDLEVVRRILEAALENSPRSGAPEPAAP